MVSMFAGLAGLAVAAAQGRRKPAAQDVDEVGRRGCAADALADAVQHQWEQEARVRSLRRPAGLRLHWSTTERPVAPSAATIVGAAAGGGRVTRIRFYGHSDEVGEKFLALPHGRLVILGEPGAGKTALAILLVLDLLGRWRPGDPVPVLLSISSWDPTRQRFHAWLARRLLEDYPALGNSAAYGPAATQRLVVSGRVLPVLDGLDEMPTNLRASAIGDLDAAHANLPLVVTCRSDEYQEAVAGSGQVLTAAAVVEIQPVTVDEATTFLQQALVATDTRWREVFEHLRGDPNGALAAALSSPLMVGLARTVHTAPDREPSTLIAIAAAGGREAVERHLLEDLIPAVYGDRPSTPGLRPSARGRRWDPESARRYLTFLATLAGDTGELAWWNLHRAAPRGVRVLLVTIGGFVGGAVGGLVGWSVAGREAVLATGLIGVAAGGLLGGLADAPPPARMRMRIHGGLGELGRFLRGPIAVGLVIGLVGAVAGWGLVGREAGLLAWLAVGLVSGLVMGPILGLLLWLRTPADHTRAVTPQSVLQGDRTVAAVICLSFALLAGFVGWLTYALGFGVEGGLVRGLVTGLRLGPVAALLGGLAGGLTVGLGNTAWGWFVVARAWLAARRKLPLRLMGFLEDAYRRQVLRQAGATWQFRHARLRQHLAAPPGTGSDRPSRG